ncbi:hypothetical protein HOY82DRAFT_461955, partial [Tuber indicum]
VKINFKFTEYFNLVDLDLYISTPKYPSPSVNPDSQYGSGIPENLTSGLDVEIVFGKLFFNLSDKPLLIELFIFTKECIPSRVRCCLHLINSKACL